MKHESIESNESPEVTLEQIAESETVIDLGKLVQSNEKMARIYNELRYEFLHEKIPDFMNNNYSGINAEGYLLDTEGEIESHITSIDDFASDEEFLVLAKQTLTEAM